MNYNNETNRPVVSNDDKNMLLIAYVGLLFVSILVPLAIYIVKTDRSEFLDINLKHALNFSISYAIYGIVCGMLMIVLIGFILAPILYIIYIIFSVIAILKVMNGETYKPPFTISFLK